MSNYLDKLEKIWTKKGYGYWGNRILAQLGYASKLSQIHGNQYDNLLEKVTDFLYRYYQDQEVISKETAQKAEEMLSELSEQAKKYKMICVAHAHIDMNWMWRWDETVGVALDTFRTMLDLMEEYPTFKFSQSQASVYKIVEDYAPDMLEKIKEKVKEGRWEVTASTWVEADKNMPNGESMARHILYTRRYLSNLLGIDGKHLDLDYEPDTFGHSQNVPEILSAGGIKYYYHCRGYDKYQLYRWVAPSGNSIIVYREPLWYIAQINPEMVLYVPEFCARYGLDTMLKVYGVGDHGGGPTRRDLDRILDMDSWPVFPKIEFGTYHDFFKKVEEIKDNLPEVRGELNFIFTGCYTSQSRIKKANRISEATLYEAEMFNAFSNISDLYKYDNNAFEKAWRNTLFNQFHDIIPGSGTIDTREYSMGLFQETMAIANTRKSQSLYSIAQAIDTSRWDEEIDEETVSEGAGVGFGLEDFKVTQSHRGRGKTRIFHIFNPSCAEREEAVEVVVWDWNGDIARIIFKDELGNVLRHQVLDRGFNHYWGHDYIKVLVKVKVPAGGYTTCIMTEEPLSVVPVAFPKDPRVETPDEFVLENERIKVRFDPVNASIVSFIDKETGEEFIPKDRPAGIFRLIQEDSSKGMTAWVVGRYMNVVDLTENVKIKRLYGGLGDLRQCIEYQVKFDQSSLKVTVSLDEGSSQLNYAVECDWWEIGKPELSIPQLSFHMPLGYECDHYLYDIPFGIIEREGINLDVPANSWALGKRKTEGNKAIMLITDSKYGFRCVDNAMNITLIRSSFDPDPYPEFGMHRFNFAISLTDAISGKDLIHQAFAYNHPLSVISSSAHCGSFPASYSFMELIEGDVVLSTVKMAEDLELGKKKLIIRAYELDGRLGKGTFKFCKNPKRAYYVDIHEKEISMPLEIQINENILSFQVSPYGVATVCVEF